MAFKSEIHVAELASIRTGHTEGDIYYILDNGMLGDLPCKPGTFVKWHNDAWQIQPDEHYALVSAVDSEIAKAIDNILDDGQASETIVVAVPSSQSSDYTVGNYYEVQGKVAKLRTKTDGDNVTQLTFDTTSGLLAAINDIGKIAVYWFSGTDYPTSASIRADLSAGKTVALVRTTEDKYEFFYLFYRAINMSHTQYNFIGNKSSLICIDGVWNEHPNGLVKPNAIAPDYDPTQTYPTVGTAVMYSGRRYVSKTAIIVAEEWNASHWILQNVQTAFDSLDKSEVFLVKAVSIPGIGLRVDKTFVEISTAASENKIIVLLRGGVEQPYFLYRHSSTEFDFRNVYRNGPGGYNPGLRIYGIIINSSDSVSSYDIPDNCNSLPFLDYGTADEVMAYPFQVYNNCSHKIALLDTQQTLTVNVNILDGQYAPNFCFEIDNSNNTDDCVVTVTVTNQSTSTTTVLNYSTSAGNNVGAGKYVQLTCVGNCWTLAEFTVPSP